MKHLFIALSISALIFACSKSDTIIEEAIRVSGYKDHGTFKAEFDIEDTHYIVTQSKESFSYERIFKDSILTIHDILNNKGFMRMADTLTEILPESEARLLSSSLDSTVFFALIPKCLVDAAFIKNYLGQDSFQSQLFDLFEIKSSVESAKQSSIYCRLWIDADHRIRFIQNFTCNSDPSNNLTEISAYQNVMGIQIPEFITYQMVNNSAGSDDLDPLLKNPGPGSIIKNFKFSKY